MEPLPLKHQILVLGVVIGALFLVVDRAAPAPELTFTATSTQPAAVSAVSATTTPESSPTATTTETVTVASVTKPTTEATKPVGTPAVNNNPNQIHRIENPYTTPPLGFETVNGISRAALVNIFCASTNGLLSPISGSGVFIDSRGIILTNAHVAQYVLLAQSGRVNMYCQIRTGSPATARWTPQVLYLPPVWIDEHAQDLTKDHPVGTGKHDYALLYAVATLDNSPRPVSFPSLNTDTRDAIGFVDDAILAASYPAEFLGSIANSQSLYPVTSTTRIDELFTLSTGTVDVVSIGSVIGAQSGSSGGGIVNAWGRLIGLITTTSEGATTADRELRGITLSYIDRDIAEQSGYSLSMIFAGDPALQTAEFATRGAPALVSKLLAQLR